MDERFQNLRERTEEIIAQSVRRNKSRVMTALLEAWSDLEKQGVEAYDFAHVAVLIAEGAMISYDSLDELRKFGEHLKTTGSNIIRAVDDNWPPVDPDAWPDNPPDWLRD